jgi:RES domain-containing protein
MSGLIGSPVSGRYYRIVLPENEKHILSTQNSLINGARFNPRSRFGALYLAQSEDICLEELKRRSIKASKYARGIIQLKCSKILDLTDRKVVASLKIPIDEVLDPDNHSASQRLARWAYDKGYDGILYNSVTGKGKAICIFDRVVEKGSNVRLVETKIIHLVAAKGREAKR